MLTITSAKFTGNPGPSGWAQIHEFKPEDPQKLKNRGHLIAVIATKRYEEGIETVSFGRELISRLHEEYFGKEEGSAFNSLRSAIEKVLAEFRESWGDIEISAIVSMDDVVYTAAVGGGQVAILREGMYAKILESGDSVVSASGHPKEEDMLLIGTRAFFDSLPAGVIKAALESKNVDTAAENLTPIIHSKGDSGSLGAVVVSFSKESEQIEAPIRPTYSFVTVVATFLGKLTSIFPKGVSEKRIYIKTYSQEEGAPPTRKLAITVGLILLVILVVSIVFGIRQKRAKDLKSRYEGRLTQSVHEYEESLGLADLNEERARELFISARNRANELRSEGVKDPELDKLIKSISESEGKILGEYRSDPQVFVDLGLLSSGFSGDDMASSGKEAFVLDKNGKKVAKVNVDTKKAELVAGPKEVGDASIIASYEDKFFLLRDEGVIEGKEEKLIIEKDWDGEVLIYAYAGNLYLLNKSKSNIYRYSGTEGGFSSKQNWFGPGVSPDLTETTSLAIDGAVWLLTNTGKILKFSLGKPDVFLPSGLEKPINLDARIYTNESLKYLYILDPRESRIVVIDKDGGYKAQYISDKIKEGKDLVVSEEEGRLVFLTGNKLYSVELKHL